MILLRDASRLALTKLRVRVPRYIITVVISSMLFAFIVFSVFLANGIVRSVKKLNDNGLSNRYFTATSINMFEFPYSNSDVIAQTEKAQANMITQKKVAAKKLGIEYDSKSETPWVTTQPDNTKSAMPVNDTVMQIANNWARSLPHNSYDSFKQYVTKGGAIATYQMPSEFTYNPMGSPYVKVIKNGKESFSNSNAASYNPMAQKGFSSIEGANLRLVSNGILKDLILPGQTLQKAESDSPIPLFAMYSVAEESLGLKPLPSNAKAQDKINRIKEVREKISGQTLQICYRNSTSSDLLSKTISQIEEIDKNKNNKDYTKPEVIYGLPDKPCGDVRVVKDSRSNDQKKQDAKQEEFDRQFDAGAPLNRIITFKIVGLLPDTSEMYTNSVAGILSSVMSSSVGGGWVIPESMSDQPELRGVVQSIDKSDPSTIEFIAEFKSPEAQTKFINEHSCSPSYENMNQPIAIDPMETCIKQGKYYTFRSYGNNAAAVSEFMKYFNRTFSVALLILGVLSALIMMGTIGRIIADSRRETAVFRAIGATRFDMSLVYAIYTCIMAFFVSISAISIGYIAALIFNSHFSPIATPPALIMANTVDYTKQFTFIGLDQAKIGIVIGVIITASLIGMLPPIIGNLRRSPIKDMRDDT